MVPTPSAVNTSSSSACGVASVEDVRPGDSTLDRAQAGLHLGDHPCGQGRQHLLEIGGAKLTDELVARRPLGEQALDICEHYELLGAESHCKGGRRGVGVDVVDLTVHATGDAADDGDETVVDGVR